MLITPASLIGVLDQRMWNSTSIAHWYMPDVFTDCKKIGLEFMLIHSLSFGVLMGLFTGAQWKTTWRRSAWRNLLVTPPNMPALNWKTDSSLLIMHGHMSLRYLDWVHFGCCHCCCDIDCFPLGKNCTIHHIHKLRHSIDERLGIQETPGGHGHQINFSDILRNQIEWAIAKGISGPYIIKFSFDNANMMAGELIMIVSLAYTIIQTGKHRWKLQAWRYWMARTHQQPRAHQTSVFGF